MVKWYNKGKKMKKKSQWWVEAFSRQGEDFTDSTGNRQKDSPWDTGG